MNILTKKEMAEKLRCSKRAIDNYVAAGFLVPLEHPLGAKKGVTVLFSEEEVENFFTRKPAACSESKQPA